MLTTLDKTLSFVPFQFLLSFRKPTVRLRLQADAVVKGNSGANPELPRSGNRNEIRTHGTGA